MSRFESPRKVENRYRSQLRRASKIIAGLVNQHINGVEIIDPVGLNNAMQHYAKALEPWAKHVSAEMLSSIARYNKAAFLKTADLMSKEQKRKLTEAPLDSKFFELQARQVELIKSLPIEAGQRVQKLALEATIEGTRAVDIAAEIANTEGVTLSRANLIARTEVARCNALITQARAEYVGATQYIWNTMEDESVRESPQKMDQKVFSYSNPPTLADGTVGNPGEFPNCRCFSTPIIPEL
jgi:SPP1 gp7 family putative phage head morphogenesis protein